MWLRQADFETKKYMQTTSKSDLEQLISNVDRVLEGLEMRQEMRQQEMRWQEMELELGLEMQSLEQGEGITIVVKELRTVARSMLENFVLACCARLLDLEDRTREYICGSGKYQDLNEINIESPVVSDLVDARQA
ncbi:hypothetical protein EDB19DRAFT_1834407 [Suillus lakei]|nr:hypothetical protein EDB19DRAFT_1834407 [Suillus lakei]